MGLCCLELTRVKGYNPSKPWVYKAQDSGEITTDFRVYVNDWRATGGPAQGDCWQVMQLIEMKAVAMGIQSSGKIGNNQ